MTVARVVERLEQMLVAYPKARVQQCERQISIEKGRRKDLEKELKECQSMLHKANLLNADFLKMQQKIDQMAQKVAGELGPKSEKIMKMKTHIAELYKKQGFTPDKILVKAKEAHARASQRYDQGLVDEFPLLGRNID